jgi:hypothetical protein
MPSHHSGDKIEYFLHSIRRHPDKVIDRTSGSFQRACSLSSTKIHSKTRTTSSAVKAAKQPW